MHHKFGRTQLKNIYDTANLMALCKICHFAFDNKEWTFLPTDITTWLQEAKAEVEREAEVDGEAEIDGDFILRCNARRDVEIRIQRLHEISPTHLHSPMSPLRDG
jgi:HNH endonuclease